MSLFTLLCSHCCMHLCSLPLLEAMFIESRFVIRCSTFPACELQLFDELFLCYRSFAIYAQHCTYIMCKLKKVACWCCADRKHLRGGVYMAIIFFRSLEHAVSSFSLVNSRLHCRNSYCKPPGQCLKMVWWRNTWHPESGLYLKVFSNLDIPKSVWSHCGHSVAQLQDSSIL